MRREPRHSTIPTPRFSRNLDAWNSTRRTGGTCSQNCTMEIRDMLSRNCISENSHTQMTLSQDSPQRKSILWENGKLGSNHTVKFSKATMRHVKKWEMKGSIAGKHSKVRTLGAKSMGSQIRGKNARRNPETGAVRPQRRLKIGKGCSRTQRGVKRYVLLSCRSLGNASTHFDKAN